MNKKWYKSLTVWFNLLLIAIEAVNAVAQIIPLPTGFVTTVALVGNVLLRFKTNKGISL